jgi:hypothetical protein
MYANLLSEKITDIVTANIKSGSRSFFVGDFLAKVKKLRVFLGKSLTMPIFRKILEGLVGKRPFLLHLTYKIIEFSSEES